MYLPVFYVTERTVTSETYNSTKQSHLTASQRAGLWLTLLLALLSGDSTPSEGVTCPTDNLPGNWWESGQSPSYSIRQHYETISQHTFLSALFDIYIWAFLVRKTDKRLRTDSYSFPIWSNLLLIKMFNLLGEGRTKWILCGFYGSRQKQPLFLGTTHISWWPATSVCCVNSMGVDGRN